MVTYLRWNWRLGLAGLLAISGVLASRANRTLAQITPDASLGAESSVVAPNVDMGGFPATRIDGGAVRGANLFHSFLEFNVGEAQQVYFANPAGTENIFSRVTGTNPSDILGTLGVDGGANLFLLNPNGMVFGPNAQLDVRGSFVASTANSLMFENGTEFSATNPQAPPLLTMNLTPGLQYGSNHSGSISNSGNLEVGQDLTLSAGNLDLQGQLHAGRDLTLQAQDTVWVRDSVVNPFIAAAGGQLLVQGNQGMDIFALNHPDSGFFSNGDMVMRSPFQVRGDAHYTTEGSFRIEQLDGSLGDLVSPSDPIIRASGNVSFRSYTGASLHIFAGGSVNIGSVTITGRDTTNYINETVTLSDGTPLIVNGSARPTLDIRAGTTAIGCTAHCGAIAGRPTPNRLTFPNTPTTAEIAIDTIAVSAADGLVLLTNQYSPNTVLPSGEIRVGSINTRSTSRNGGDVVIDSRGGIVLTGNIDSRGGTLGGGGDITLTSASSVSITNGARLIASTEGQGDAGNINITAADSVSFDGVDNDGVSSGADSQVREGAVGNGGDINITTRSLSVTGGAYLSTSIFGQGSAGNINITATDSVSFDGVGSNGRTSAAFSQVNSSAEGRGGNININTPFLSMTAGARLSASTEGQGDAGNINITASDRVSFDGVGSNGRSTGVFSQVLLGGVGHGGDVNITTGSLSVTGSAFLSASTSGIGDAGNVNITATDSVSFAQVGSNGRSSGAFSELNASAVGKGGNININTPSLSMTGGARLSTNTEGQGNAGNINITADRISFDGVGSNDNASGPISQVTKSGVGNGGNINITTGSLSVTNGAFISSSTRGRGNAGNVSITATDSVSFDGMAKNDYSSGAANLVNPGGVGNGGNLTIATRSLSLTNGAFLSASTSGTGDAGYVNITATDSVSLDGIGLYGRPSAVFSQVNSGAVGDGASLNINTRSLSVTNGARLSASTNGQGNAGDINITASDSISFEGVGSNGEPSGAFSQVNSRAVGNGGNLTLSTRSLSVSDRASVSASSVGQGSAGNLELTTHSLMLDRQGQLTAETASGQGGNIILQARDLLLLRDGSRISTTAGTAQAGGDGGNIAINAQFIIAVPTENSDITANAFTGRGGNINITTQGIYGLEFRPRLTRFSDITASSEFGFNGLVEINTPDVDPSRGLAQLPINLVEAAGLIDRSCAGGGEVANNSFIVTQAGLPPNPNEALNPDSAWEDWRMAEEIEQPGVRQTEAVQTPGINNQQDTKDNVPMRIVEAQGWVKTPDGQVILVAQASTTPLSSWLSSPSCQDMSTTATESAR